MMTVAGKGRLTRLTAVTVSCLMAVLVSLPAQAATKTVGSVALTVGLAVTPGDPLPNITILTENPTEEYGAYVMTNSEIYRINYAEWESSEDMEDEYVGIGDEPKMRVYLQIIDPAAYAFRGSYSSRNVSVKGGKATSTRREANEELSVLITLNGVTGQYSEPINAGWLDNDGGTAVWDEDYDDYYYYDEYASAATSGYYDVYLYRGNMVVYKLEEYKGTTYDFYPYMTKEGTYYYKIRTVPHTAEQKKYGKKSEWVESDEIYIDAENVSTGAGQSNPNSSGPDAGITNQSGWVQSNGYWYYRLPSGQYQANGWLQVGGIWYLFDSSSRMLTGWQMVNGIWYYMRSDGAMLTGWQMVNGVWYYLQPSGAMQTGWLNLGGVQYFLNSSGAMLEGWQIINNSYYYFYPGSGAMAVNTMIDSQYWVDASGVWTP